MARFVHSARGAFPRGRFPSRTPSSMAARSVAVAALAAAVCTVRAEEPTKLPTVDVVSRYENEVGTWDSASQGAVTGETLRKQPLLRPAEALEAVPGMVGHAAFRRREGEPVLPARLQPRPRHRLRAPGSPACR